VSQSSEERTEQPTTRRIQDARRKGKIARTKEAGQAASLIAATVALGWLGGGVLSRLGESMATGIGRMGALARTPLDQAQVTKLAVDAVTTVGIVTAPVALTAIVTVMALHAAQGGWVFASEALHIDWNRLNPATGLKRLGPSAGGVELLRMVTSVVMIGVLGWLALSAFVQGSGELARLTPADAASEMWTVVARLIKQSAIGLLAIAGADYFVQRHRLMKSLKMTRREVKDDHKMTEGNPEIKSRVRRVQREMVKRRMLAATKKATVVITNPTHYAVALEYRRSGMNAPVVAAKGQGYLAQRMKAIAREHGIPMVENVPLARALYAEAEVGDVIPGALFEAVAEVLAYLIRLKQLVL
jgi:flagellar biosynthetic protein FlhB